MLVALAVPFGCLCSETKRTFGHYTCEVASIAGRAVDIGWWLIQHGNHSGGSSGPCSWAGLLAMQQSFGSLGAHRGKPNAAKSQPCLGNRTIFVQCYDCSDSRQCISTL